MVNAQEYIEKNFPKDVNEVIAIDKQLEGSLDLSEYNNLTCVDIGINSRLTSLQLAHSSRITFISICATGIDNFSFLAYTPNIHAVCLPRGGDKIGSASGNAYFSKAIRESCQEKNKLQNSLEKSNRQIQTQLDQEKKKNSDNSQRIKELEQQLANVKQEILSLQSIFQQKQQTFDDQQSQIKELYDITFSNSTYNFTNLKKDIIRLKFQELAPQVRNESANLVQLISEAKNKAGNFSSIVDLILETQKQIVQNSETLKRENLSGKKEAYQTILASSLADEELQTLLNKQTEVLELETHLKSLKLM
ncbi:18853_t:CDS:1 [Funneliformis geosporum]|nr:18853_t:CDS:1 [Funneliformis geosporum]